MPDLLRSLALPVFAAAALTGSVVATGTALNSGEACCPSGAKGEMTEVAPPKTDIASTDGIDGVTWLANLEVAKERAAEDNRLIYMTVGGSDWCPPCIQMHKNLYAKEAFQKWAKENVVLVEIDFPRRKPISEAQLAYNEFIEAKYEANTYPTVLALNADGTVNRKMNIVELLRGEVVVEDWLKPLAK